MAHTNYDDPRVQAFEALGDLAGALVMFAATRKLGAPTWVAFLAGDLAVRLTRLERAIRRSHEPEPAPIAPEAAERIPAPDILMDKDEFDRWVNNLFAQKPAKDPFDD